MIIKDVMSDMEKNMSKEKINEITIEVNKEIEKINREQMQKDKEVLRQVEDMLSFYDFEELMMYVYDDDIIGEVYDFKLVESPKVKEEWKQIVDWDCWFKYVYIDQHCLNEDYYFGTIWVPIKENLYLQYGFNC